MGIPAEEWAPGSNHPRGPASAWAAIGGVAIVVLVIIALLAALFGLQQRNKLRDRQRESQQIQTIAGQTVAALTTYDYQNLDAWKKAVLAHATGAFQNSFNNAVEGAKLLLAAAHNRSTGAVQNVFVGPVSGGKDTAGVVVDVTVTGLSGTRLIRYFQQVTLLKVGGQWRVDDMQVSELIAPSTGSSAVPPTGTAPSGGAAPATTVPPATHP
jgi:Mce-associated membrane protein